MIIDKVSLFQFLHFSQGKHKKPLADYLQEALIFTIYPLSFTIYHLAKHRFAQSHAACNTKSGSHSGENWHYQLNHQFPSFFFHKVTNLSPCPQWSLHPLRFPRFRGTETPRGREPAQRAVMQTTLKQATKSGKEVLFKGSFTRHRF